MKTVMVAADERPLRDLLDQASQESLILRTADGREFVLAEIDDFDHEIQRTRQNTELMRLLDARGREKATITLAEARARLGVDSEPGQ